MGTGCFHLPALCLTGKGHQAVPWPGFVPGLSQAVPRCVPGLAFQLSSAALLSILVFLPSALVLVLLLVRMGRKFRLLKEKGKCGYKKSSIEVSDE